MFHQKHPMIPSTGVLPHNRKTEAKLNKREQEGQGEKKEEL